MKLARMHDGGKLIVLAWQGYAVLGYESSDE